MRIYLATFAVLCSACGHAATGDDGVAQGWERHALAGYSISVEMPCTSDEITTEILPLDNQVGCVKDQSFYALAIDDRSIEEIESAFAKQGRLTVSPMHVAGSVKAFSALAANNASQSGERHAFVELSDGKSAWVVHLRYPVERGMQGLDPLPVDEAKIDQFFDSIEVAA